MHSSSGEGQAAHRHSLRFCLGEMLMTKQGASHTTRDLAWKLLAEFAPPDEPGSQNPLAERVAGVVQELGLQPAQVEHIQEAVAEAVREATQRGQQDQNRWPAAVQIWISNASTDDRAVASSKTQRDGQREHRGWGFFMIQKHVPDLRTSAVASQQLIELFLYQERERSR